MNAVFIVEVRMPPVAEGASLIETYGVVAPGADAALETVRALPNAAGATGVTARGELDPTSVGIFSFDLVRTGQAKRIMSHRGMSAPLGSSLGA